ncbi:endoribonuclease YbeY isoform X3 [Pipistrellus kuhlii]|uniref:endoribonuclease YbeY isoform X3 n=1 Tax=Pipistrellus kuhlii TaxID=59472 RepID=UPI00174F01D0|nr:endoribonuclease YbeY isoform X3 [Pipistrellus kuhlii]XP_045441282.1 endoribonuclease YbeY isoform X3 [Pipistrellus kuhlii]
MSLYRCCFLKCPGRPPEMSLVLRNLQRAIPLRRVPLRQRMEIVRSILGVQKFDLGIICVDNKSIQHINRIYRQKNIPTDVLSFPFHENLKAGEIPQPDFPDDYNLGDIFLGVEYIFQQCKENEDYYDILTMYQKEKQILEELSRRTGATLQPLSRDLF